MPNDNFRIGGIAQEEIIAEQLANGELPTIQDVTQIPSTLPPDNEQVIIETPIVEQVIVETPIVDKPIVEKITTPPPVPPIIEQPKKEIEQIKLDDELQKIYNFKKETNGTLSDYMALQKDWDKISDIDIIKNKIKEENKYLELSDNQLMILANKKLGIEILNDLDEMDETDKLLLKIEAGKERENQKNLQNKYNTLTQKNEPIKEITDQANVDKVMLSNGEMIDRKEYETARNNYLNERNSILNSLKSSSVSIEIGTGDLKKTETFEYIYEQEDKQNMLSLTDDVPLPIYQMYADEKGNLNHKQINEDLWWSRPTNRNKAISKLLTQARSNGISEVMKQETNVNFETKMPEKINPPNKPLLAGRDDIVTVKMQF